MGRTTTSNSPHINRTERENWGAKRRRGGGVARNSAPSPSPNSNSTNANSPIQITKGLGHTKEWHPHQKRIQEKSESAKTDKKWKDRRDRAKQTDFGNYGPPQTPGTSKCGRASTKQSNHPTRHTQKQLGLALTRCPYCKNLSLLEDKTGGATKIWCDGCGQLDKNSQDVARNRQRKVINEVFLPDDKSSYTRQQKVNAKPTSVAKESRKRTRALRTSPNPHPDQATMKKKTRRRKHE